MLRVRHVLSTWAATLVGGGLGLLLTFAAARILTPTENGHYAQYLLVMNLIFIALNLGVGPASTYYLASGFWNLRGVSRLNVHFVALVGLVVLLIGLTLKVTPAGGMIQHAFKAPAPVLYAGLASGVMLMGVNQAVAILMGCHRYDRANVINVLRAGLALPFVIVIGLTVGGEMSVILSQSFALIGVLVVALVLLPGTAGANGASRAQGRIGALLRYGGLAYLSNLFHFIAMRGLLLLLSFYFAPEHVGYFNLALLLLEAMLLFPSAIGQLVFPQSSLATFNGALIETLVRLNIYISLLLAVIVVCAAEPLTVFLIGSAYAPVGVVLTHLAPAIVLLSVPRILSQLLSGQGFPGYPLAAAVTSTLLGLACAAWWIPAHGIVGAAWVTNVVAAITAAVTIFGYCSVQRVGAFDMFKPQQRDLAIVGRLLRGGRGTAT